MSVLTEQISQETLSAIKERAERLGLSADQYVRNLLPDPEGELALAADIDDAEFEADMSTFAEDAGNADTFTGDYSREDIYVDHD